MALRQSVGDEQALPTVCRDSHHLEDKDSYVTHLHLILGKRGVLARPASPTGRPASRTMIAQHDPRVMLSNQLTVLCRLSWLLGVKVVNGKKNPRASAAAC